MKTSHSKRNLTALIVLIVLIGGIISYIGYQKYNDSVMVKRFAAERDAISLPGQVKLTSSTFEHDSQAGLPHYAPHAIYLYSYDRAQDAATYEAITDALKNKQLAITGHDISTPDHHIGGGWYVSAEDTAQQLEVRYAGNNGTIRLVISRKGDIEPDSN